MCYSFEGEVSCPGHKGGNCLLLKMPPFQNSIEICGAPVLSLFFSHSGSPCDYPATDFDVFAYLVEIPCVEEELGDDMKPIYLTEGQMRASHRAEQKVPTYVAGADPPVASKVNLGLAPLAVEPWHSFKEGDASPFPADGDVLIRFSLLPLAWRVAPGNTIGLILQVVIPITSYRTLL